MSSSWPHIKLGSITCEEREPVGSFDGNGLPVLGVTNVMGVTQTGIEASEDKSKYFRLRPNRFVYNPYRVNVGSLGLTSVSQDGIASPAYVIFRTTDKLDSKFLYHFLKSHRGNQLINFFGNRGTVRAALRFSDLSQIEIPLPPLAEQRRIVVRVEEVATKIANTRSLRQQAADECEMLVGAQSAKIFRKASRRGTIPLESIAVLERGKFSHRPRNDPRFFGGLHPWIQIGQIESAGKVIRKWTETLNDEGLAISKKFPKGTVLISIAATIGSVGILDFDCCIPDSIVGVTPREGTDSEYIYYYLTYLRSHLEEIAPQSAQKNINLQILSPLPVPKLTLSEQRQIVAELDTLQAKVDTLKRLQSETSVELDALLPAILDRAFKGELL